MLLTHIDKWGPAFWQTLHTITFTYPNYPSVKEQRMYRRTITLIGKTLPCSICRQDYLHYLQKHPPDMTSRYTFSKYMVDLHNDVNKKLNKPTLSYDEVQTIYLPPNSVEYISENPINARNAILHKLLYALIIVIVIACMYCLIKCLVKKSSSSTSTYQKLN